MGFMDKVKAKAEEWDVQGKAEKLAAEVDKVAHEAKDKAAEYADENRDKVRHGLDRAGAKIDERTEGKYSDKIVKAKESVTKGVDKLADQRPGGPTPPSAATYPTKPDVAEPYRADPIDAAEPIDYPEPATEPTGWPQDSQPR